MRYNQVILTAKANISNKEVNNDSYFALINALFIYKSINMVYKSYYSYQIKLHITDNIVLFIYNIL